MLNITENICNRGSGRRAFLGKCCDLRLAKNNKAANTCCSEIGEI
jgi:hypothetical protein